MNNSLPQVHEQYEALPYPPREPAEERQRLVTTWLDSLAMINHYCFAGEQDFKDQQRGTNASPSRSERGEHCHRASPG
jgi:hypothetical protein